MTHTIAVINQKGGVGKTTTAVNLSACLASKGYKTLLIDADAQANASISFGAKIDNKEDSFYDFLIWGIPIKTVIKETKLKNLHILPANDNLYVADTDLIEMDNKDFLLRERLKKLNSDYDYIIIDSPPHLGLLTVNIMTASTKLLVPLKADFLALQGLTILVRTYEKIKKKHPDLKFFGLLLTMYSQNYKICREVEKEVIKHLGTLVFRTKIPQNVTIAESPAQGNPVVIYDTKSVGAMSYKLFADEFLNRINECTKIKKFNEKVIEEPDIKKS
jgi:chromosome partitioning protein